MKWLITAILVLAASIAFADEFTVTTGFGYFENAAGKKVAKYELSPGVHQLAAGFTAVEVANATALESIQLDDVRTQGEIDDALIEDEIHEDQRARAIERLKAKGKLPANWQDRKNR